MKTVSDNPKNSHAISLTTYDFTATSTNGSVTATGAGTGLLTGQSVYLVITGGDANGFAASTEYFVIKVDANTIKLASTLKNALDGVNITTTGDAGAGTIHPFYKVGGVIFVGVAGNINMRGLNDKTPLVNKNVPVGFSVPVMIKDVCTLSTTATDLIAWYN